MIEEDLPRDGEPCRAPYPGEQRRADLPLQMLDLPAQRGLGDLQPPRGAEIVLLLGDRDEGPGESELQHA
jgi:hypothetical protein